METYKRNDEIIDGEMDDQQVMMHLDKGMYYGLNAIGKRIWDILETAKSFDEIKEVLVQEFEVTNEQCEKEVQLFLDEALKNDIIKKG